MGSTSFELIDECECSQPQWNAGDSTSQDLGIDRTENRFGEVSIRTCNRCGQKWLHYFVEYEHYSRSGRWFRGKISEADMAVITAESAVAFLSSLEWYAYGGSYFDTTGKYGSGPVKVA